MATIPEVIITDIIENIDTVSSDDEKDDIKTKNQQVDLLSITDDSSSEDIFKTYESSTNKRVVALDTGEKAIEIDVKHFRGCNINQSEGIEQWKSNINRDKFSKYRRRNSIDTDKDSTYLQMKNPFASPANITSEKETLMIPPDIYGGNSALLRSKVDISPAKSEDINPKITDVKSPFSLDNRNDATKLLMEDDSSLYLFPLDNEEKTKDNASVISAESNASMSTLKDIFQIKRVKDLPVGPIVEPGNMRSHSRLTGFYRNCPQTFVTKNARLKRRDWTNTGFVVAGLYVFGFLCLGYTVLNTVSINPIIIILGVILVSLASLILYLIYAIEKNRTLYTLSSGERRKVTFSNPFPAVH